MRVATVESSTLATVAYDEARELSQLGFCSHAVYQYFGVPSEVHQALLDAPSKSQSQAQGVVGYLALRLLALMDRLAVFTALALPVLARLAMAFRLCFARFLAALAAGFWAASAIMPVPQAKARAKAKVRIRI